MENFSVIYTGILTNTDQVMFDNPSGCIVKNFMVYNQQNQPGRLKVSFDTVDFFMDLQANEMKRVDILPFTKKIIASGEGINVHLSGLVIT